MKGLPQSTAYRLAVAGMLLWAIAGATYGILRLTFGPRPVLMHVRWAPGTDEPAQDVLERRYGLTLREPREGRTSGYTLTDVSRDNIRALVGDPAVEDTHYIHRLAFRPWRFAPRRPYQTPYPRIPAGLEVLTVMLVLAGGAAIGVALLEAAAPRMIRGPLSVLRRAFLEPRATSDAGARKAVAWLGARIPPASAEAVALFRVAFGSALVLIVLRRPVRAEWAADSSNVVSDAHRFALRMFTEAPWITEWMAPWVCAWGALFIAGARAGTAFAMLSAGVFAWALLHTTETTYHSVSALLAALLCLLPSRWSDAWSIDAWWRRTNPRPRGTPREYGYTVWVPGVVMGVVLAAAAVAKLRDSGIAWILNGTVKYHFLSDSSQAMVGWGVALGPYHGIAVLLSFAAIALETLVIVGVLSTRYTWRLAAGIAALSLLAGFALFQGIRWPGWWVLLLSFLPWHLVRHTAERPVPDHSASRPWRSLLQPAGIIAVIALIAVQTVTSLLHLEVSPLISSYDMYSTTYGSPAEYEQKAGESYWIVAMDDEARHHECRISRVEAEAIVREDPGTAAALPELSGRCFEQPLRVRSVELEARRVPMDWARWRPREPIRRTLRRF